jgi:hypothetical protein
VFWHLHQQTREAYGALKLWRVVPDSGIRCGRHRVARLRELAGLEARPVRRSASSSNTITSRTLRRIFYSNAL